jgi:quercetin dioxygenase-like cupin family protein
MAHNEYHKWTFLWGHYKISSTEEKVIMRRTEMRIVRWATILCVAASGPVGAAHAQNGMAPAGATERARVVFSQRLPKLDGNRLKTTVLEVNYGPGESSTPHSHPCAVTGYVILGAIRTQVEGQPERVVKTGESFYEAPNAVHLISANASQTEPASFLAFFVCDHEAPLSSDVSPVATHGGKH